MQEKFPKILKISIITIIVGTFLLGTYPLIKDYINERNIKNRDNLIERIKEKAKMWSVDNSTKLIKKNGKSYYLTISKLKEDEYLKGIKIIDPITKIEFDGCIKIVYEEIYKDYIYSYINDNCQNIITASDLLTHPDNIVSSDDGLYITDDFNYVYKGKNPNNYIMFEDKLYRIVKIDKDGIKIISSSLVNSSFWDNSSYRLTDTNPYCIEPENGCNALLANNLNVSQDSQIYTFLTNHLTNLSKNVNNIVKGISWNIGKIENIDDLTNEKNEQMTSDIGMINISEYQNSFVNNQSFINIGEEFWTITSSTENTSYVWYVDNVGIINKDHANKIKGIRPMFYLNSSIKLIGDGTLENPYMIKNK